MIEKLGFESAQVSAHSQLTSKLNELIVSHNELEERIKKLEEQETICECLICKY